MVLYEALSGALPFGYDHREILRRHNEGLAPRPPPDAPHEAVRVIMAMLQHDPEQRPASAAEVMELLGGPAADQRVELLCARLPEQATQQELQRLFCGPDLFLHLREDAAAVLYERTEGWRAEVVHELGRWLRQGLAHYREGLLSVGRVAIDRLGEAAPPLTLRTDEALDVLHSEIEAHLEFGRVSQALGRLDRAVGLARRFGRARQHRELLELWVEAALFMQDTDALDRCLCELGRGAACGVEVEDLGMLVRGFWCAQRGEAKRGEELLAPLGPLPNDALEHCAQTARVVVAARTSIEAQQAAIERARSWATTLARRARYLSWRGLFEYRTGDYAAALESHTQALALETSPHRKLTCLLNCASSALEVPELGLARELAQKAQGLAQDLRLPHAEAGAFRSLRGAQYRANEAVKPSVAAVDAVDSMGPWRVLSLALTEAAIAWRTGDNSLAIELALRSRAAALVVGFDEVVDLAQALAWAAGHPEFNDWRDARRVPGVAAQTMALRALAGGPHGHDQMLQARELCRAGGMQLEGPRRDVLSCAELLRACEHGHL